MGSTNHKSVDAFLLFGACMILFGILVYPAVNWLIERDTNAQFCTVCIAVGLLAVVLGVGRILGWSKSR